MELQAPIPTKVRRAGEDIDQNVLSKRNTCMINKFVTLGLMISALQGTILAQSNYQYDAEGRLTRDLSEGIVAIEWNNMSKVVAITRADTSHLPDVEFVYDARGQRITKIVKPRDGTTLKPQSAWEYTYYVNDPFGHSLAVYDRHFSTRIHVWQF